ncbi:MAG: deoxyguanosinetriphosphate triphosphohydrolase [Clostridiales bacterium]|nr:deoxyguanosinetriphosphate triphosphohydrolase [Clostridiales bacterium]
MTIREQRELWEAQTLSPRAALSANTRGRAVPIAPCPVRTDFVRDRDRILHSKAFRRLKHKTQVFLAPQGDHYRTRLTHTLEVSQIARTLSRALLLNEDLTEAIAMGHDLGHTPFGHAGENVLNELVPGGFSHNAQSLRIVEKLENLNLTFEVRDGIFHHKQSGTPATLEGRVVSLADRIAYLNHDIDDAIRAGVLAESDLPTVSTTAFGHSHGTRINAMIMSILAVGDGAPDVPLAIDFLPEHKEAFEALRDFMFKEVYFNPRAKGEEGKAKRVVRKLFEHYRDHPDTLPPDSRPVIEAEGIPRACADFIAGMTDNYAIAEFERLFVPTSWN